MLSSTLVCVCVCVRVCVCVCERSMQSLVLSCPSEGWYVLFGQPQRMTKTEQWRRCVPPYAVPWPSVTCYGPCRKVLCHPNFVISLHFD